MNVFNKEIWRRKKFLREQNEKQSDTLSEVPREQWPQTWITRVIQPDKVLRSKKFLCQLYYVRPGLIRLWFNRAEIDKKGAFVDGMSWDELQQLKTECGYANFDAVEIFPNVLDVVNVANMRHLWVFQGTDPTPLDFVWRKHSS